MAYCVKCGESIPGKYTEGQMQTCIHCSPTIAMNSAETVIRRPAQKEKPKTSRAEIYAKGLISFLILSMMAITAAGLIIFGLIAIAANLKQNAPEQARNEQTTQPQQTPLPQYQTQIEQPKPQPTQTVINRREETPEKKMLINDALTFSGNQGWTRNFRLDRQSKIVGSFTATGGGRNDIQCLIMDEYELENYKNGNQFRRYYDSGSVTNGKLQVNGQDIILAPGNYAIVFKNPAWFDSKAVKAKIWIESIN